MTGQRMKWIMLGVPGVFLFVWMTLALQTRKVDDNALRNAAKGTEWLTYGQSSSEQRFSTMTQINPTNVGRLGLAWSYEIGEDGGKQDGNPVREGLTAWDPVTQKERWFAPGGGQTDGGVLTTASNLVVQTTPQGHLMVYTADKGEKLLDLKLPLTSGVGPPMTYQLDNKQYIAVMAGTGAFGGRGGGGSRGGNRGGAPQEPTAAAANVPPAPATPPAAPPAPGANHPRLFVYTIDAHATAR